MGQEGLVSPFAKECCKCLGHVGFVNALFETHVVMPTLSLCYGCRTKSQRILWAWYRAGCDRKGQCLPCLDRLQVVSPHLKTTLVSSSSQKSNATLPSRPGFDFVRRMEKKSCQVIVLKQDASPAGIQHEQRVFHVRSSIKLAMAKFDS